VGIGQRLNNMKNELVERNRSFNGMPVKTVEGAKGAVKRWLKDRAYLRDDDTPLPKDLHFRFKGDLSKGIGFNILQPKNLLRSVVIVAQLGFDKVHLDGLNSMNEKERDNLLWDLRRDFIFVSPSFVFDDPSKPSSIQFSKEISYDELTEGKLQDTLEQITRCMIWVSWVFNKEFGEAS
jgi:hypothetical protein